MNFNFEINGADFAQAGDASSKIKRILQQVGIPTKLIRRVAIAVYEAEMNIVIHAFEGNISLLITSSEVIIVAADKGPGIKDLDLAMQEGYSTADEDVRRKGFGAGMGLPNMKRSCDIFKLHSIYGEGTTVTMRFNLQ